MKKFGFWGSSGIDMFDSQTRNNARLSANLRCTHRAHIVNQVIEFTNEPARSITGQAGSACQMTALIAIAAIGAGCSTKEFWAFVGFAAVDPNESHPIQR